MRDLLNRWHHRFRKAEKAHYASATGCRLWNYGLGIPLVVITTVVASETFGHLKAIAQMQYPAAIASETAQALSAVTQIRPGREAYIVITLGILAPVLAALQTFLRFPERAEKHRAAAARFGQLKREVEQVLAFPPSDSVALSDKVQELRERDVQIHLDAPSCGTIALWWARRKLGRSAEARSIEEGSSTAVQPGPTIHRPEGASASL